MDVLTSAADAILNDKEHVSTMKIFRPALRNMTNVTNCFPNENVTSSFNSLLRNKITCSSIAVSKSGLKTPGKRRKNSIKFGDENKAPSPKTPKNEAVKEKFIESPVTPLSNLKMLTRIASMEEPIPSRKTLFGVPITVNKTKLGLRRCISEGSSMRDKGISKPKLKRHPTSSDLEHSSSGFKINKNSKIIPPASELSRREKSLGLLCERFLEHFPIEVSCLETPRRLVIDDVAALLGTERRRVYDIVNILECLNMASRVQKNMYQWMGKQHLETTLSKLKALAEEWGIGVHLSSPIEQSLRELKSGNTPSAQMGEKRDERKEKSIGILCQKFLMLFLTSPAPHVIQLDTAIHLLLGQEGDDLEKLRTRGRRIYDIANVLVALHLIKKLPQCKSFMYVGPQVEAATKEEPLSNHSQIKLRHSLLPPPLATLIHQKNPQALSDDFMITPSDNSIPFLRKGKPRKLDSEFFPPKAKRNCLDSSKNGERKVVTFTEDGHNLSSLKEICKVAEVERKKLNQDTKNVSVLENAQTEVVPLQKDQKPGIQIGKTMRFSHFGSPRMALTFQNPSRSPPLLTGKPFAANSNVSRVMVKPPFVLHTINVSNSQKQISASNQKAVYVIRTNMNTHHKTPQEESSGANKTGFRVYSRKGNLDSRSMSLPGPRPSATTPIVQKIPCDEQFTLASQQKKQSLTLVKSLSQTSLPNISLNTLSRSHYKTVFGSSSQIPNSSLSSPSQGSYRFVINTKEERQTGIGSGNSKEVRQPTFVKIFQNSPDNSSTDSELESIFGDAFKFTRPKNLVNKD